MRGTMGSTGGAHRRTVALLLVLTAILPAAAAAQTRAMGILAGPVQSRHVSPRDAASKKHAGFMAGAWIDQQTPASWFSVTAEAYLVRRGAVYPFPDGRDRQIDADYLGAALLPTLRVPVGPLALVAYAGPAMEFSLRTRSSLELQAAFRRSAPQVFAGVAGAGLEFRRGRATVRLEARINRHLRDAFDDDAPSVQHRSDEFVFRLGMRPRR